MIVIVRDYSMLYYVYVLCVLFHAFTNVDITLPSKINANNSNL